MPPDPTHIPFTVPKDIKWEGDPAKGQQTARLFGDPSKPGLYGLLIKWIQGHTSRPHFHDQMRYAYVVSGTWWVSSSSEYDMSTLGIRMHAGTFVTDIANTVHWDGSKATDSEPAILELVGMGPVKTVQVDENGKPLTRVARRDNGNTVVSLCGYDGEAIIVPRSGIGAK